MSLFEKRAKAIENKDAKGLIASLHDDFNFVRHQTGSTMNKADMSEMLRGLMSSDAVKIHSVHYQYENEEVLVEHTLMKSPDGSCEAIVGFCRLKTARLLRWKRVQPQLN